MKKGKKFLRMTALVGCILLVGGILLTGAGYVGMGFSLKAFTHPQVEKVVRETVCFKDAPQCVEVYAPVGDVTIQGDENAEEPEITAASSVYEAVSYTHLDVYKRQPLFPQGVNTEFLQVVDSHTLKMRVWERGSGETMACGTGACASAVAAILCGHCPAGKDILVRLRGGDLTIRVEGSRVWMTGEAVTVFEGTVKV